MSAAPRYQQSPAAPASSSSSSSSSAYPPYSRPTLGAPRQNGPHRSSWPPFLPPIDVAGPSSKQQQPQQQGYPGQPQSYPHHHQYGGHHPHSLSVSTSHSATSPVSPSSHSDPSPVEDSRQGGQDQKSSDGSGSAFGQTVGETGMVASLTGTGRKRKRLQRACVPCHKAKRRCDGGLPCSNCDFSGRGCSYSDSHGNAVQPTARAKPPASKDESAHSSTGINDYRQSSAAAHTAGPASNLSSASTENFDAFRTLNGIAPFNALIPLAYTHGTTQPSVFITHCANAMVSPHNHAAVAAARRLMLDEDQAAFSILDRPSADSVLALVLLALCEARSGKLTRAVAHTAVMCRMMQQLNLPDVSVSTEPFHAGELCRLVAVAYTVDIVLSSLAGQSFAVSHTDLEVAAMRISQIGTQDPDTAPYAALLRSSIVFAQAVEHQRKLAHRIGTNNTGSTSSFADSHGSAACHHALSAWADSLPSHLAFEDGNLSRASRAARSSGGVGSISAVGRDGASSWAWAWSLMHCFAEMAVCVLDGGGRQSATAASNLSVLCLDTVNLESQPSAILALLPLTFAHAIVAKSGAGGATAGSSSASTTAAAVGPVFTSLQKTFDFEEWQLRRTRAFLGISAPSHSVSTPGLNAGHSSVTSSYATNSNSNAYASPAHHYPHYSSRSPSMGYTNSSLSNGHGHGHGHSLAPPPPPGGPLSSSASLSSLPSLRARGISDPRPRPPSVSPPHRSSQLLAPLSEDGSASNGSKVSGAPVSPYNGTRPSLAPMASPGSNGGAGTGTGPTSPHSFAAARRLPGLASSANGNGTRLPSINGVGSAKGDE
ncbi:hypothetical protein BDZ90DRAFT_228180 [Jaminaea rosea]|uniref:Zn(2)-C6 fungal-type domain-containing protein n=1 Tax=Jaminaea rosea TaxID=1569628 RepID=A0A316UN98_9BASI|nr:hypothetical protein BDZ90DRAFT_228180 [Jaminaea rosea]PWN25821.1 hypothetical protein BDZ90DRAFT_228180 [Jaminaea rosea]